MSRNLASPRRANSMRFTLSLAVQVHAGRGELLQEHVDLAVELGTSRHVASLPSARPEPAWTRTSWPSSAGAGHMAAVQETARLYLLNTPGFATRFPTPCES